MGHFSNDWKTGGCETRVDRVQALVETERRYGKDAGKSLLEQEGRVSV
jgi:hypothetical protein